MGWLGWDPKIAMRTDVNAIEIAMAGRIEMLNGIFGKKQPKKPPVAARWSDFAKTHNEVIKKRGPTDGSRLVRSSRKG